MCARTHGRCTARQGSGTPGNHVVVRGVGSPPRGGRELSPGSVRVIPMPRRSIRCMHSGRFFYQCRGRHKVRTTEVVPTEREVLRLEVTTCEGVHLSVYTMDEADVRLQSLVSKRGSTFTLLAHQHVAARAVAGVPAPWPFEGGPTMPGRPLTRGLILADEMGLGKTVSVLSGLIARATFDQGPVLIIGPSWAVIEQWVEHAQRSGYPPQSIHLYRGGARAQQLDSLGVLNPERSSCVRLVFTEIGTASSPTSTALSIALSHKARSYPPHLCHQCRAARPGGSS